MMKSDEVRMVIRHAKEDEAFLAVDWMDFALYINQVRMLRHVLAKKEI